MFKEIWEYFTDWIGQSTEVHNAVVAVVRVVFLLGFLRGCVVG